MAAAQPTELWCDVAGEGPLVVLLPEASRPAGCWPQALVDGLVAGGRSVARVDLRDQGRSAWPAEPYDFDTLVRDVAELLEGGPLAGAAPSGVQLAGWGLGGAVALAMADRGHVDADSLTLVATSGWVIDPQLPGPDEPVAVALVWRTRGGTEGHKLSRALGRELRTLSGPADRPGLLDAQRTTAGWVAWGFNPEDRQRAAWLSAPPLWGAAAALRRGRCRVTVVHGRDDPLVPVEHGRLLAELSGGQLIEVPGAGHELSAPMADAVVGALTGS